MTAELLERRLYFVVGKGGVGKSTVAAALALALAVRGRRVLLCGLGAEPLAVAGVERMAVDGERAFAEYLGRVLPSAVAGRLAESRLVRRFVGAAPGLRELMAIGKIADEERRTGAGAWDALVVDAPATGHALETLRMPRAAMGAFGGLVRREAARILGQMQDPARTAVWLVSLAEELPARETLEAAEELRARLELPLGALVVNGLCEAPVGVDGVPVAPAGASAAVAGVLRCAREQAAWAALNRKWLGVLEEGVRLPLLRLPRLPVAAMAERELRWLGEEIARQAVRA